MANIEIGIGGDLTGLRGRLGGRSYDGDFEEQFVHLKELITLYDPAASIEFIESCPPKDRAEEFGELASKHGMPVKQFSIPCDIGGGVVTFHLLRENLDLARRAGTVDRINLQVLGDNNSPTIDELVQFFVAADEIAKDYGIELYTETHVDRFTYDPRRLIAVHEALLDRTAGRLGIRVSADFSHYIHQLDNPNFCNWPDIASGRLNLDPLDSNNYVSRNIISRGLVGYGHLRVAIPNHLTRTEGTIQYPLIDPKQDPETAHLSNGGMKFPWHGREMSKWFAWYREVFRYQLSHPRRPVARFSSEYIGDGTPGYYRVDQYRNLFQNIAMVSFAHSMLRESQCEMTTAA